MTLDLGAVSDLQSLLNTTTIKKEPIESDCFCFHDFIFDDDDGDGANDGAEFVVVDIVIPFVSYLLSFLFKELLFKEMFSFLCIKFIFFL